MGGSCSGAARPLRNSLGAQSSSSTVRGAHLARKRARALQVTCCFHCHIAMRLRFCSHVEVRIILRSSSAHRAERRAFLARGECLFLLQSEVWRASSAGLQLMALAKSTVGMQVWATRGERQKDESNLRKRSSLGSTRCVTVRRNSREERRLIGRLVRKICQRGERGAGWIEPSDALEAGAAVPPDVRLIGAERARARALCTSNS